MFSHAHKGPKDQLGGPTHSGSPQAPRALGYPPAGDRKPWPPQKGEKDETHRGPKRGTKGPPKRSNKGPNVGPAQPKEKPKGRPKGFPNRAPTKTREIMPFPQKRGNSGFTGPRKKGPKPKGPRAKKVWENPRPRQGQIPPPGIQPSGGKFPPRANSPNLWSSLCPQSPGMDTSLGPRETNRGIGSSPGTTKGANKFGASRSSLGVNPANPFPRKAPPRILALMPPGEPLGVNPRNPCLPKNGSRALCLGNPWPGDLAQPPSKAPKRSCQ